MPITHESILKLIAYRFKLGYLNKRHRYASNIGRSFNFTKPNFSRPELPDPVAIVAVPCALQGVKDKAERPKPHDLELLQSSGLLDALGYKVPDQSLGQIFRMPDSIHKALVQSGSIPG